MEILYFPCDHLMKENTGVGSNLAAPAHGPRVSTEGWVAGVGGVHPWCRVQAWARAGPAPTPAPSNKSHTYNIQSQAVQPLPPQHPHLWPPWHREERRSQEPRMTVNVSRKVLTRLVIQEYTRISNALRWLYLLECSNCESVWLDKMRIVNECYKT